jgi:ABC-type uncharacterized transport system involved in gliding motility auxiliary subunit
MEINKKSRRQLRLQGATFVVLFLAFIGLTAWLSTQYHYQADWTAANRNTLAEASVEVLKTLQGPATITVFARETEAQVSRRNVSDFISRYQRHKPDLKLEFVNPDLDPAKVREYNVMVEGELAVEYQGRRENVQSLNEEAITNALQRLARGGERPLVFVQGHGERKGDGQANHDLGAWGEQLRGKGFLIDAVNLAQTPKIPEATSVLVLAGAQVNLLPGEVQLIREYLERGGNLLWLADPGDLHGLKPLADSLGIGFIPGVIVDPTTQVLGIGNPTFAVIAEYPSHPVTQGLDSIALLPTAAALALKPTEGWQPAPLLRTVERAWSETGAIAGSVGYDAGKDIGGPLTVGIALSRERKATDDTQATQRVVVVGDGDFLSNAFIGNGANLDVGNRLVNWLSHQDAFVNIPARAAPDVQLEMTKTSSLVIGFGFLVVIPALLLGSGIVIWLKRRKR